jgi:anti-anti-sigma factor
MPHASEASLPMAGSIRPDFTRRPEMPPMATGRPAGPYQYRPDDKIQFTAKAPGAWDFHGDRYLTAGTGQVPGTTGHIRWIQTEKTMAVNFTDVPQDGATVVAVSGRLDGTGAPGLEAHCLTLIKDGTTRLALDLAAVDYISSAGLRSLLVIAKSVKAAHGALALCCLAPMVREVMAISCFDRILMIVDDRTAALASLR